MTEEFEILVIVENDVNVATIGEKLFGVGKVVKNIVFVTVGTGIGAGIIIKGKLHRDYSNAAVEIGYFVMGDKYLEDYREGFGCLERLTSGPAIVAKAVSKMQFGAETSILSNCKKNNNTQLKMSLKLRKRETRLHNRWWEK